MTHLIKVKSFDKVTCGWVYAYINPEKIIMLTAIEDEDDGTLYMCYLPDLALRLSKMSYDLLVRVFNGKELGEYKGSRVNNVFVFQCSEIKDPVDCGVHMLKPCIHKYFKDHNYNESTSKVEKQMAIVALCHRIEEGLIDYLDELEEFNS